MFGFVNVYVFNNLGEGAIRVDIVIDEDSRDISSSQSFRKAG